MKLFAVLGFLLVSATVADKNFIQPLIVGGVIAQPGLFTYMAPLHAERINAQGMRWSTFCGSSLISDEFVLTAAHCVADPSIINVKLTFGTTNADMNAKDDPDRLVVDVPKENIIVYEGYNPKRSLNDIALVRLPQKITFTRMIEPVRLPTRSQPELAGDVAVVTGWGSLGSSNEDQNKLRYAQLRIFPQENCRKTFGSFFHDSNICLDGTSKSPCYGDSGGPAVVVDREDRLFTLVGVASYVSHKGCEKGEPVGYARVTSFLDWIHEKTGIPIKD